MAQNLDGPIDFAGVQPAQQLSTPYIIESLTRSGVCLPNPPHKNFVQELYHG